MFGSSRPRDGEGGIERVREVEADHNSRWSEAVGPLVHVAQTPADAAEHPAQRLGQR